MDPCSLSPGRLFLFSALIAGLAVGLGCDSNPNISPPSTKPRPDAATSSIAVNRATDVLADGKDTVIVTITVREQDSTPVPDAKVHLEVSGEGHELTPASGKTDERGVMTATLVSTRAETKRVTASVESEGGAVMLDSQPTVQFVTSITDPCAQVICTPPAPACSEDGSSVVSYTSRCIPVGQVGMCQNTPASTDCFAGETCIAAECRPMTPEKQEGRIIVSEFRVLGSEFIELYNTTTADIDIQGFTLVNGTKQIVDVRSPSDPSGTARTPVIVPAGGILHGVANPSGTIPGGVGFVYGLPGTSFSLADAGDTLALHAFPGNALEDAVDFRRLVTNPDLPLEANAFVAFPGSSTQLAPERLTAEANDMAIHWCVSFQSAGARVTDTAGMANGSCHVAVINEVLIDASGTDDARTFVEIAGPGGAVIGGAKLLDIEGRGSGAGTLNTDGDLGAGETDGEFVIPAGTRIPADGILLIADAAMNGTTSVPHFVAGVDVMARDMDPENGGTDAMLLVSGSGNLLDAVGYDTTGANLGVSTSNSGLAMYETATALYSPVGASLMRSTVSTDTGQNRNDFRADPSPTPGLPNDTVAITVTSLTPDDGPAASGSNEVSVTGTDLADGLTVQFGSNLAFACIVLSSTNALCTAPGNANTVERVNVKLTSPESVGAPPVVLTNAFTYTGTQNETNDVAEADMCNLHTPTTLTVQQNQVTPRIYGRIAEAGVTDVTGAPSGVIAEVGYGNETTHPASNPTWRFFPSSFQANQGSAAEFAATLRVPPVMGTTRFSYTYRFSVDGGLRWTYCDLNGAGSNVALTFETDQLGVMIVNP